MSIDPAVFAAWATGKTAKIWNGVDMRWEVVTPDTIKVRAGDEWISLREAIERWAATQEREDD